MFMMLSKRKRGASTGAVPLVLRSFLLSRLPGGLQSPIPVAEVRVSTI
jgi:hypothetical protein